jgi:hypothetical protein
MSKTDKKPCGRKPLKSEQDRRVGRWFTASDNELKRYGGGSVERGLKRLKRLIQNELEHD